MIRGTIEIPNLDIGGTLMNGLVTLYGSSTDTKPTDETIANGSVFVETDTQKVFMYDEENSLWREWFGDGGGGSGGGGGGCCDEPFVKVYETVLTEATELNELWIRPEDMGLTMNEEAYIDVSVYVSFDSVAVPDVANVRGLNFLFGQVGEAAIVVQTDYAESDLGRTYISGAVYSQNGLLVGSYCVGNYKGMTGFFPMIVGERSPLYPQSPYYQGVTVIRLQLQGETSGLVFPVSTRVQVYARRKVNIVFES